MYETGPMLPVRAENLQPLQNYSYVQNYNKGYGIIQ